jgi:hypothetical protein
VFSIMCSILVNCYPIRYTLMRLGSHPPASIVYVRSQASVFKWVTGRPTFHGILRPNHRSNPKPPERAIILPKHAQEPGCLS